MLAIPARSTSLRRPQLIVKPRSRSSSPPGWLRQRPLCEITGAQMIIASWILIACSQTRTSASRYPTRQPVIANDFENVPTTITLSRPGRDERGACVLTVEHEVHVGFVGDDPDSTTCRLEDDTVQLVALDHRAGRVAWRAQDQRTGPAASGVVRDHPSSLEIPTARSQGLQSAPLRPRESPSRDSRNREPQARRGRLDRAA